MLLTGDAEAPVLEDVAGEIGHIDVLKMGHHGSKESVSKELLDALDPCGGRWQAPAKITLMVILLLSLWRL